MAFAIHLKYLVVLILLLKITIHQQLMMMGLVSLKLMAVLMLLHVTMRWMQIQTTIHVNSFLVPDV